MGLIDVQRPQPTAADGARRCRTALRGAIDRCHQACREVRQAVQKHGRQEIAAALGDDAAELATLYGQLKDLAMAHGREVEDLPS